MTCDLVYPLAPFSHWQDNELRYSLRSVERYLRNYGEVYLIGHQPRFTQLVRNISAKDNYGSPSRNIAQKLMIVCNNERISDPFLYIHDDHFFTTGFDASEIPNYYRGDLTQVKNPTDYMMTVQNTIRFLQANSLHTLDFDTHAPMLFNKIKLMQVLNMVNWNTPHGYCIKSLYGNATRLKGTHALDGKFVRQKSKEQLDLWFLSHPIVSIDDCALDHALKAKFESEYPEKSKFEM